MLLPSLYGVRNDVNAGFQVAQAKPFAKLKAIAAEVSGESQDPVSRDTVRRRLAESKIVSRVAATKSLLTETHKGNRLLYAQEALDFPDDYWTSVKFSDEKPSVLTCRPGYMSAGNFTSLCHVFEHQKQVVAFQFLFALWDKISLTSLPFVTNLKKRHNM